MQVRLDSVSYAARPARRQEERTLLHGVSLEVRPGRLVALLGPSGAGKSTLLDVVAGRKRAGTLSGALSFDGRARPRDFARRCAYVLQQDLHEPVFSPREALGFAARLRLPASTARAALDDRVDLLLDTLRLAGCADTPAARLSGGEAKRLSIATELVGLPDLVCLDEPTSGLDSELALGVVQALRTLADRGYTVLSTVHQPSPEVAALFDDAVVLAQGSVIYAGPMAALSDYFRAEGYEVPADANPADVALQVARQALPPALHFAELADAWDRRRAEFPPPPTANETGRRRADDGPVAADNGHWHQCAVLLDRHWAFLKKEKRSTIGRWVATVTYSVFAMLMFWDLPTSAAGAYDRVSLCFFVGCCAVMNVSPSIPFLHRDLVLFRREHAAGASGPVGAVLAPALAQAPGLFVNALIMSALIYFAAGMRANGFVAFVVLVTLLQLQSFLLCQFTAALCGNEKLASLVFPSIFIISSNVAGFTMQLDELATGWQWISAVTYLRWGVQGMVVNEFPPGGSFAGADSRVWTAAWDYDGETRGECLAYLLMIMGAQLAVNLWVQRPRRSRLVVVGSEGGGGRASLAEAAEDLADDMRASLTQAVDPDFVIDVGPSADRALRPHSVGSSASTQPSGLEDRQPLLSPADDPEAGPAGCVVSVRGLCYSVPAKPADKQLLRNISFEARPGRICAIMGPSGAGKSTLLDVIAGLKQETGGELGFDGAPRGRYFHRTAAYVPQTDEHIACFSVRETLEWAALLRLDESWSAVQRAERVDLVLGMLDLAHCADTRVGGALSGGELRRLSVGVEIITLPALVCLDEPTTGLDSETALDVMASVAGMARAGRTVLLTIHQPGPQIVDMLDDVLLLASGGVPCFFGALPAAVAHFQQLGFALEPGRNHTDFLLQVASGAVAPQGKGRPLGAEELSAAFVFRAGGEPVMTGAAPADEDRFARFRARSPLSQAAVLSRRALRASFRDRAQLVLRLGRNLYCALIIGSIYYQTSPDSSEGLRDRVALLYYATNFQCFGAMYSIPVIFADRQLFRRERAAGACGTFAYWCSQFAFLPFITLVALEFAVIVYPMAGLHSGFGHLCFWSLVNVLMAWVGVAFAQWIAAAADMQSLAMAKFNVGNLAFYCFSGFQSLIPAMAPAIAWIPSLSMYRWGLQALARNEMAGEDFAAAGVTGSEFLEQYGFQHQSKWLCVFYVLVFWVVLRGLGYRALKSR